MDIARLVLEYLRALVWPLVALALLYGFRQQVRELSRRVIRGSFLGVEVEMLVQETDNATAEAAETSSNAVGALAAGSEATSWLEPRQSIPEGDSPGARTHRAINNLERLVRRLAYEVDQGLVGRSTRSAAHALVGRDVLDGSFLRALGELLTIRDSPGMTRTMSVNMAEQVWSSAQQLVVIVQLQRHALSLQRGAQATREETS
ncbi:hypothetical protein [Streptomyces sp. DT18]